MPLALNDSEASKVKDELESCEAGALKVANGEFELAKLDRPFPIIAAGKIFCPG